MKFRKTKKIPIGSSFHNETFYASVDKIKSLFGEPTYEQNGSGDKVNYEWVLDFNGHIITIYDWKEYRALNDNEIIEWHIGGHRGSITKEANKEIALLLK